MILNDFFDGIYCVNLDHRNDKWEDCKKDFDAIGCNLERFSAINGFEAGIPPQMPNPNFEIAGLRGFSPMRPGQVGCLLSHLGIIRLAISQGMKNVMIVEDDVAFDVEKFPEQCDFLNEIPVNWDMIYFGGNHQIDPTPCVNLDTMVESKTVSGTTCTFTTHCLAINLQSPMLNDMVFMIQQVALPVDVCYAAFHAANHVFTSTQKITWQKETFSDIEQRVVNYDSVLKESNEQKI